MQSRTKSARKGNGRQAGRQAGRAEAGRAEEWSPHEAALLRAPHKLCFGAIVLPSDPALPPPSPSPSLGALRDPFADRSQGPGREGREHWRFYCGLIVSQGKEAEAGRDRDRDRESDRESASFVAFIF